MEKYEKYHLMLVNNSHEMSSLFFPNEALLMSTNNICFHGEIKTILTWYPLLFSAMLPDEEASSTG